MIRKTIDSIQPHDKIGETIYSSNGKILIVKGTPLTSGMLNRLKNMGYTSLYVSDVRFDDLDIKIASILEEETRKEAMVITKKVIDKYVNNGRVDIGADIFDLASTIVDDILNNKDSEVGVEISGIQSYDEGTFTHSLGMTIISLSIAQQMGLSRDQMKEIALGCLLHDIGKTNIPLTILNKTGLLTHEEFEVIKKHPFEWYMAIKDKVPLLAAHIALQHHEKYDGTGYPRQLKGTNIHLYGRITAIADVFEAITADRPYRKGMNNLEAVQLLTNSSGSHFDEQILSKFLEIVTVYPNGTLLQLNNHLKGIVYQQNKSNPLAPKIFIYEEGTSLLQQYYSIDLQQRTDISIQNIITP